MHWEGRQLGRLLPIDGLVGRILIDQISTEDKKAELVHQCHVDLV